MLNIKKYTKQTISNNKEITYNVKKFKNKDLKSNLTEDLILFSIFSIEYYSARNINYVEIIIKSIYIVLLVSLIVSFDIILSAFVIICSIVILYRLIIILVSLAYKLKIENHKNKAKRFRPILLKINIYKKINIFAIQYLKQNQYFKYEVSISENKQNIIKQKFNLILEAQIHQVINIHQIINKTYNHIKSLNYKNLYIEQNIAAQHQNTIKTYPIYSVLIPIYKEISKIKQILKFIKMLDYPKDKLDVCILIEEDDLPIHQFFSQEILPSYIRVISVPIFQPRTKPKALNYATNFIKGEYVVVYDAEDIPDMDQLKKALHLFQQLPSQYICIQSRLNFYNYSENIITECFSVEYSILFDFYLFGLDFLNLPILLGGTSNHFKVKELKKIGFWDSYNVTEDAELSIRIYSNNYKIKMLDSLTLEESPIEMIAFIKQRSRWIKGFLQTFFCYVCNYQYKKFNIYQVIFIIINLLFFALSLFLGPILIVLSFFLDIALLKYNLYIFFIYHAIAGLIVSKNNIFNFKYIIFSIPYYFLHMFAFILAIYDLIKRPFHWRKTEHGKSKIKIN